LTSPFIVTFILAFEWTRKEAFIYKLKSTRTAAFLMQFTCKDRSTKLHHSSHLITGERSIGL
jgi:hypothetical protein